MKILFLRQKGEGFVGAPQAYHEFELAVGKIVECKWAGMGWLQFSAGESMEQTVQRLYGDNPPDWVFDGDNNFKIPAERDYKVGYFVSDLHGKKSMDCDSSRQFLKLLQETNYDAVFLKYKYIYGVWPTPKDLFIKGLTDKAHFLPWSVDLRQFYPREKYFDVAFLGAVDRKRYPLRHKLWKELPKFCKEHKLRLLMKEAPPGKTFERRSRNLKYIVGDRYRDYLGKSRILIFGSSKFKYPLQKYFEGMASGCLVMADEPSSSEELHFVDGASYIKISKHDWKEKLEYYSMHKEEAQRIAAKGREIVTEYHTHDRRAKEFVEMLEFG